MAHLLVALTSHGYGHAAQTAPIVNTLRRDRPDLRLTLRTDLPRPFLATRFQGAFDIVPAPGDFGLAMESALAIAFDASAERYARLHTDWDRQVEAEASALQRLKPDLVIANISYLVPAAARAAGIPAITLCSFTWAQIYAHYFSARPEAAGVLAQMHAGYASAGLTLALEPRMPLDDLPGYRPIGMVAKRSTADPRVLRTHLGLATTTRLVSLSLGGIDHALDLGNWPHDRKMHWLVPKAICPRRADMTAQEDLPFSFTDLLASSDAFITKAGYGSFTEAACNGIPTLYVPRPDWPEEPCLLEWMSANGLVRPLSLAALRDGSVRDELDRVWQLPRPAPVTPEGIATAAAIIDPLL
ncbi:MAG: hypothetical protein A2W18_15535 [Candidatus Muproteobacteria bacterium RBG_16_60_9]|uniref:Glycosyl transferase family 28 C-terminal domain-containing protein n=1 Tax=Candidatus Muproteobacteria bacterium RBG_16_60_9 TaxID=1817755 RepID=A0A1F6VKC3_9PROT|nr:MAG: hypothetical protein A2W18_15535 [Candidatus Muproteobacteria bacterium RBG_16_60_9]